jgi:hypothetical protein
MRLHMLQWLAGILSPESLRALLFVGFALHLTPSLMIKLTVLESLNVNTPPNCYSKHTNVSITMIGTFSSTNY